MATYKVVDADKLDADLESVADSIRAKAGTTEQMSFPAGFKSAVDAIQSGGDSSAIFLKSGSFGFVPNYTSAVSDLSSGTSLTETVDCGVGDLVIAAIVTRDTLSVSGGWTLVSTSGVNSTDTAGNGQRLSFACKYATSTSESLTVTQASAQRLYIVMVALPGATGYRDNGYSYKNEEGTNITVTKSDGLVLWACSSSLWDSSSPYSGWIVSNNSPVLQLGSSTQSRLCVVLDETNDESVTFTPGVSSSTLIVGSLTISGIESFVK